MMMISPKRVAAGWLGVWLGLTALNDGGASTSPQIEFNRQVRPLLSDKCYACHGPDQNTRKGKLRLDTREGLFSERKGKVPVVPGQPDQSEIVRRINSEDPDEQMPPPDSKLALSPEERALLKLWIAQGGQWQGHWAFIAPRRPPLPQIQHPDHVRNAIDAFIVAKLEGQGLEPSPPADKERLLRRVTMDLTGSPPTLEAMDAFQADAGADAYEKVVDRLLPSEACAERLALDWMDLSRYADSHGLHADGYRLMWPWRDWVIQAFSRNMPYDTFVTWQLAGDLLPHATDEQILATAFHRNHPMTAEGGVIDEEFRLAYVFDRTQTTATAFLGLTMECARCHDHKFDPIQQKEYYQLSAFFNNVRELGMTGDDDNYGPMLNLPTPEERAKLKSLDGSIVEAEKALEEVRQRRAGAFDRTAFLADHARLKLPKPKAHYPFDAVGEAKTKEGKMEPSVDGNPDASVEGEPAVVEGRMDKALRFDDEYDIISLKDAGLFEMTDRYSSGVWIKPDGLGKPQSILGNAGSKNTFWRGWDFHLDAENHLALKLIHGLPDNYLLVRTQAVVATNQWTHVLFAYDGSGKAARVRLFLNGRPATTVSVFDHLNRSILPVRSDAKRTLDPRAIRVGKSYRGFEGEYGIYKGCVDDIRLWDDALTAVEVARLYAGWTKSEGSDALAGLADGDLLDHELRRNDETCRRDLERLAAWRKQRLEVLSPIPEVMVMEEMSAPRVTHRLKRGQYDAPLEEVQAGTPASVLAYPENAPKNRLGLARWLFDSKNPLTARVTVNRYWQLVFGRGIVDTPEDFGSQGSLPTHPELLDWLAIEFMESGWNVRHLLKLMVMSGTYAQSSAVTQDQWERDPSNRWLARSPSYRLPAEIIRDHALAASGLLSSKVGGPSVKPFQPVDLWIEKASFSAKLLNYKPDPGESLYRRSLYTFIRRTSPHPVMTTFDAPNRDVCTVKRERTSSPLQALILMNDPEFVEAARVLAERLQRESGPAAPDRIQVAFRLLTGRRPEPRETQVLADLYATELERFRHDGNGAQGLLSVGDRARDASLEPAATAALAMVVHTLMNHDEFYMKR